VERIQKGDWKRPANGGDTERVYRQKERERERERERGGRAGARQMKRQRQLDSPIAGFFAPRFCIKALPCPCAVDRKES